MWPACSNTIRACSITSRPTGVGQMGCWFRSNILVSNSSSSFLYHGTQSGLSYAAMFRSFGEMAELINGKNVFQLL